MTPTLVRIHGVALFTKVVGDELRLYRTQAQLVGTGKLTSASKDGYEAALKEAKAEASQKLKPHRDGSHG